MFVSRHMPSRAPKLNNFGEFIMYAYANMQMLIMALNTGREKFDTTCYMVRAKAFKAYREGRWKIHDLYVNNVWKMRGGDFCWYCRTEIPRDKLTIDHIFPRSKAGADDIDNIVFVCKSCNSSKSNLDLLEWYAERRKLWPMPYIFAYYLKHVYYYALENGLMNKTSEEIDAMNLPFKYQYIPLNYPDNYIKMLANGRKRPIGAADNPESYMYDATDTSLLSN